MSVTPSLPRGEAAQGEHSLDPHRWKMISINLFAQRGRDERPSDPEGVGMLAKFREIFVNISFELKFRHWLTEIYSRSEDFYRARFFYPFFHDTDYFSLNKQRFYQYVEDK